MAYPYTSYQNPYQQGYYPYQQPQQAVMQPQHSVMQPQQQNYSPGINQSGNQVQNGGFVTVRSEQEARAYPVAPGTSITFKHENAPYCYTKTMGFSQLEAPKFEKFRLVKEEAVSTESDNTDSEKIEYAEKSDVGILATAIKEMQKNYDALRSDLESTRADLDYVMTKRSVTKAKKEAEPEK